MQKFFHAVLTLALILTLVPLPRPALAEAIPPQDPVAEKPTEVIVQYKNWDDITVVAPRPGESLPALLRKLGDDARVEYAEPNYARTVESLATSDPYTSYQWALDNTGQELFGTAGTPDADIDLPEAWGISTGTQDVIIAVIDTGVYYTHPDLASAMWDGSACVDEQGAPLGGCVHGYDFAEGDKDPLPAPGDPVGYHGTHVAGIAAASVGNGIGIAGVAPRAKVMALRFDLNVASEVRAIDFARRNGAKIINASYTGDSYSQAEHEAIERFVAAGGIFVAAAGNDHADLDTSPRYPAADALSGIISVAATNSRDQLASFSNWGTSAVDVGAPGDTILSTYLSGDYAFADGTSMAAPLVAGVAALLWSYDPTLSATSVRDLVINRGDTIPALAGKTVTGKRVNAYGTLLQARALSHPPVAVLFDTPATTSTTTEQTLDVRVGGDDIAAYTYRLDTSEWSTTQSTTTRIVAASLSNGTHTLQVRGSDVFDNWQSEASSTRLMWEIYVPPLPATTTDATSAEASTTPATDTPQASTTPPAPEPTPAPAPAPSGGGGGGGGGGGSVYVPPFAATEATTSATSSNAIIPTVPTPTPSIGEIIHGPNQGAGQVLGAQSFRFTKYLVLGSRGLEVTELQKLLARLTFFSVPPTGYFGAVTKRAVVQYQKTYKIPQVGTVGPMTRASLNAK